MTLSREYLIFILPFWLKCNRRGRADFSGFLFSTITDWSSKILLTSSKMMCKVHVIYWINLSLTGSILVAEFHFDKDPRQLSVNWSINEGSFSALLSFSNLLKDVQLSRAPHWTEACSQESVRRGLRVWRDQFLLFPRPKSCCDKRENVAKMLEFWTKNYRSTVII